MQSGDTGVPSGPLTNSIGPPEAPAQAGDVEMEGVMAPDPSKGAARLLLEVEALVAGYSRVPVVNQASLKVAAGQIVALVGANGSGKSTLMKALIGLITPTDGQILLMGENVTSVSPEGRVRRGLGYVPQVNDVFSRLSVRENLEMGGYRLPRRQVAERVDELMEVFPALRPVLKRNVRHLSGGQRKLVAIARVLMTQPKLLLLDEPTVGLTPQLAEEILQNQVTELTKLGCGVLLVEQRVAEAFAVASHAYVLVSGGVRAQGAPKDVASDPGFNEMMLGMTRTLDR